MLPLLLLVFGLGNLGPALAADANWSKIRPELIAADTVHNPKRAGLPKKGPVIVTFFASWCPPCTLEFKHLNEINSEVRNQGATIIGINLHEDFGGKKNPERMKRFIEKNKPKFALYRGTKSIASKFGGVPRIPTVVLFDQNGQESWRFVHKRNAEKTHATGQDILDALAAISRS